MKIKSIKKIKSDKPVKFYDITVEDHHNFAIGDSNIIAHNSSITGALNKLARPFGNALQILDGYGFFGSEVSPDPAAARYTSVKLSSKTNEILNKYKYLTTREPEASYHPFWMDVPLGLTTAISGIAVGYNTKILPRKLEHIKEFLLDKRQSVKPYFEGFNGKISKYKGLGNAWLLSSIIKVDGKKIHIEEIPPVLKYTAALKKIDTIVSKFEGQVRIVNNSNTVVDIDIVYSGRDPEQFKSLQEFVQKTFSIIVNENPVFIKDGQVLVYDNIEQYLEDYKWQVIRLKYKNTEYERNTLKFDFDFNMVKKLFITWVLENKRTDADFDGFMKKYPKNIRARLDSMTSRRFTIDELKLTDLKIKELEKSLKGKLKDFNAIEKLFKNTEDPTIARGVGSKKMTASLFETEDVEEIDGVMVWDGDDIFEEKILEEDE